MRNLFAFLATALLTTAALAAEAVTVTPTGQYAMLRLQIEGVSNPLFVPFRDGKGRVDHGVGITREGGWIQRSGDRLAGRFETWIILADDPKTKDPGALRQCILEATVANDAVTGTCTIADKPRKVSGTWQTEAQIAAANPLAAGKDWPAWTGPVGGGTAAQPAGVKLVDSLAQAKLAWRSEEAIGTSMGSINRFMQNWESAISKRTSGQSASPVLGDGKVFLHQRVPAGEEFSLQAKYGGASKTTMDQVKAAGFEQIPWYAMEKYLLKADEVIVAMDARTGKTLWKTSLPLRAPNVQYHKDRGGDRTPVYVDGKLVAICYNGDVVGLDAATGKVLWEKPGGGKSFNPALAAAGNVVAAPMRVDRITAWVGLDAATGQILWKGSHVPASSTVAAWASGDKHYFLIPAGTKGLGSTGIGEDLVLRCVEARSGAEAWTMPFPTASDRLGIVAVGDVMVTFERLGKAEAGDEESKKFTAGQVVAYTLSAKGAQKKWSVPLDVASYTQPIVLHGKFVVAMGQGSSPSEQQHKVIDLATGKVISAIRGPGPENGGYAQAMEDMVLVRRDGTHGRIEFAAYKVDTGGQIRALAPPLWSPPGPHTTSYHHPFMYPLADGRIFVRQADGIYCYDLRQ